MEIKEFRAKIKDLAIEAGLKRSNVNISISHGAWIIIDTESLNTYRLIKSQILRLAGFKNTGGYNSLDNIVITKYKENLNWIRIEQKNGIYFSLCKESIKYGVVN
jgi:hypothetical protein